MAFWDIFSVNSIDNAVDAVINTGDAIWYTDEEKAQAHQLAVDTKLKMLPLYEPFKLAQRYIALAFTINFILAFWVGVGIWFFSTKELLTEYLMVVGTFELGWIMLTIIAWYFGGGFIESFKRAKK